MAKKASTKSSKTAKTASKRSAKTTIAPKTVQPVVETPASRPAPRFEPRDEHLVLSHLMWILFLFSAGLAAVFTVQFLMENATSPEYFGVAALVLLAWAFVFKIFAHRVHGL